MMPFLSMCQLNSTDYGCLVWGKVPGSRIWPGIIVNSSDCGMKLPSNHQSVCIFWYGDNRVSMGLLSKTYSFTKYFNRFYSKKGPTTYLQGIQDILQECCSRASSHDIVEQKYKNLVEWAKKGFESLSENASTIIFSKPGITVISKKLQKNLNAIKKTQLSFKSQDEFPITTDSSSGEDSDTEERNIWKTKAKLLKDVRNGTAFLESICIACERGEDALIVAPHPLFQGGLCKVCKDTYESIKEALRDNGKDIDFVCAICCSPGELVECDNEMCDKLYCLGCIELLVCPSAVEKIKKTDPWKCFLCTPYSQVTHGLLSPKPEWASKCWGTKQSIIEEAEVENFEEIFFPKENLPKQPLRVMSLFDGISTGYFALEKLKIDVDAYFASEVDEDAKNISKMNFGNKITYLGDILKLTDAEIKKLCPIDLLIGGSPCNDLSFVNPNRKGLYDPTGTGILFFHYFRIQKLIQIFNGDRHLFWLYENVVGMQKEYKDHISRFLQKWPVVIDAQHFSAQQRARNFWGNIPGMYNPIPKSISTKNVSLSEAIYSECNREAVVERINCVTTNPNSLRIRGGMEMPIVMNGKPDVPWITEIEKIFGFPTHYTDVGNLGVRDRQALLGRSWSVPVVCHILSPLKEYFSHVENMDVSQQ